MGRARLKIANTCKTEEKTEDVTFVG